MDAFVQCRHHLCSNISICVLLASIFNIHLHIFIRGQTGICQQDVKQNIIFTQASHIKCKVASSLDTGSVWRLYWRRLLHIDLGLSVTILTFFTMMDRFSTLTSRLPPCLGLVSCLLGLETKIIRMFPKISHLRHYAKRALTPRSLKVKLGPRRNYHKGRAAIRHYANQTARPLWPLHRGPNFTLRDRGVNARLA